MVMFIILFLTVTMLGFSLDSKHLRRETHQPRKRLPTGRGFAGIDHHLASDLSDCGVEVRKEKD
jgi:hypothetical protein